MRNWLLAGLLCLLMPFGAMAASETINFGDLDDAAIAELKLQIEQRKQQHAADPTTTAQTVSEYTLEVSRSHRP